MDFDYLSKPEFINVKMKNWKPKKRGHVITFLIMNGNVSVQRKITHLSLEVLAKSMTNSVNTKFSKSG